MFCNKCGKPVDANAKFCNYCGNVNNSEQTTNYSNTNVKVKKKVYQQWWFWLIIILFGLIIIGVAGESDNIIETSNNKLEITLIDFSSMKKEEIENWCNENKLNCIFKEEYSDIVKKGSFVSQSIDKNGIAHQGDKITVIYSLGKEPTTEEKNALKKAEIYSNTMYMSKQGIYNQLTSSVEGFTEDAAQYAIDNIDADWNKNALEKAKTYQQTLSMSKNAIYKQLISSVEGFTKSEAQYAVDNLD